MTNMQIPTSYGVEVEVEVENLEEEDFWWFKDEVWCETRNHALYFNNRKNWGELLEMIEGNLDSYDPNISHTIIKTSFIKDTPISLHEKEVA